MKPPHVSTFARLAGLQLRTVLTHRQGIDAAFFAPLVYARHLNQKFPAGINRLMAFFAFIFVPLLSPISPTARPHMVL